MKRDCYLIATIKRWNIENFHKFCNRQQFHLIVSKEQLVKEKIDRLKPRYIFFPHWSWVIPKNILSSYECVMFHMTDLPYGRGGSPLQNLILRNHQTTKISAFRVDETIDGGDIYLKKNLSLKGNAKEIYSRASKIIFNNMIPLIVSQDQKPAKQKGSVVYFKRKKPKDGNLFSLTTLEKVYDHIRMLDAEDYPKAFLENKKLCFNFTKAKLKSKKALTAQVEITCK